jgi:cystathionine beta-lyase
MGENNLSRFDEVIDRRDTNSLKYDFAAERGMPDGLLSFWVADMDFPAPPEVIEDISRAVRHGIFGYTETKGDYFDAVAGWFGARFGYAPNYEWLVKSPGVVYALATAVRAYTNSGDAVLIQRPVYYPFSETIIANGRKLVNNPLVYENGVYVIDFDDFERKIRENDVKLFLLCSPHNPVGRVWTKDELSRIGEICVRYGCVILSDEIHCDFVYSSHKHTILPTLSDDIADNVILCTAPSKTFNLAGLQTANIFIKNPGLRKRFINAIHRTGYSQLNTIGLTACKSAYLRGGAWLDELNAYIYGNIAALKEFLADNASRIKVIETEGTYLVWLDFCAFGLRQKDLSHRIIHEAKLWLDDGVIFGPEGEGFQRINVACPRSVMLRGLERLLKAGF